MTLKAECEPAPEKASQLTLKPTLELEPKPVVQKLPEPVPKSAPNSIVFDTPKTKRKTSPIKLRDKFKNEE